MNIFKKVERLERTVEYQDDIIKVIQKGLFELENPPKFKKGDKVKLVNNEYAGVFTIIDESIITMVDRIYNLLCDDYSIMKEYEYNLEKVETKN